jgi:hypothetical protein
MTEILKRILALEIVTSPFPPIKTAIESNLIAPIKISAIKKHLMTIIKAINVEHNNEIEISEKKKSMNFYREQVTSIV